MNMKLDVLRNVKQLVRDHVHDKLKKNIMELKLEPGRFISEQDVVEMLQVSRTPIREEFDIQSTRSIKFLTLKKDRQFV